VSGRQLFGRGTCANMSLVLGCFCVLHVRFFFTVGRASYPS
jgi:hypothetical protein